MNIKRNGRRIKLMTGVTAMITITGVLMHLYGEATEGQKRQRAIADQIIRLHVVANSDSDEDQEVKKEVKETIVTYLRGEMADASTIEQARGAIREHIPEVEEIAEEKLRSEGFSYSVSASLESCYFPIKQYGDMTFPAGEYEALRIKLGESSGHNWWCVMYPSLCMVDAVCQNMPDESKNKLKESLTQEEYESLLDGGEDISYGCRIWEWICGLVGADPAE